MSGWQTLVDPASLFAAMSPGRAGLVLVDCRFSLADARAGRAAYAQGHVPGAIYAHLRDDLSGPADARAGRHPWPDADALSTRLRHWGVTCDSQVVAYDDGDGGFAARLWFLLVAMGHDKVAVLDGGVAAWQAAGFPLQPDADGVDAHRIEEHRIEEHRIEEHRIEEHRIEEHRVGARRTFSGGFDAARLVDAAQVQAHIANGGLLLDARATPRFRGDVEPIDPVAGHIPGAASRPYVDNLCDGRFKSADRLRREFAALIGNRSPAEVVVMCGSGVTACHHLLAMAHAGLPGARLYAGSWSGWISDPVRPVATGDQP